MITGVVLARDEERNIVECLRSFFPHVDELLLVDMESKDQTVALARPFVRKVLSHPIIPNFDSARNIAIPEAAFDWIWFLDADERVSNATACHVKEVIAHHGDQLVAITIPFKSYFCGKWIEHCGWWPGYTMPRVLKRGHFRFPDRIHSGVEFDGPEYRVPPDPALGIDHFSYESIEHYFEKFNRYTTTESKNLAEQGAMPDWRAGIEAMVRDLWLYYERGAGRLDGRHGWILSWLAGQYRWAAHAKLLDRLPPEQKPSSEDAPVDLDDVFSAMRDELTRLRADSPNTPLQILWRSPLLDPSGYAEDARLLLRGVARGEREVCAEELRWSEAAAECQEDDLALIRALLRSAPTAPYAAITSCIPTLCAPDPKASLNILRATFETDRIPTDWLPILDQFDEIWVFAEHNRKAFIAGGAAPEKIQVLPGVIDTKQFCPTGDRLILPDGLENRFVFLSIFDWQIRKGWDVLLRAYCETFKAEDGAGLLLKVTRNHGHPVEVIQSQMNDILQGVGESLESRPDIVLWDETLSTQQLTSLYRRVGAFVLATRGEGWGRPLMEAMATGLPTIGTQGSGNDDFMTDANSFLIPADWVDVPEEAVREIPVYQGHRWLEPNREALAGILREVFSNPEIRASKGETARRDMAAKFDVSHAAKLIDERLRRAESRFAPHQQTTSNRDAVRVNLDGEFFASHSFANINERIADELSQREDVSLSVTRRVHNPVHENGSKLQRAIKALQDHTPQGGVEVTIRHAFPPNFQPPDSGYWVHIQPWEFGSLPRDWVGPLRDQVDEIWAPTEYVKQCYVRSGIASDKIHVIPWGVDPTAFNPDGPALKLPTVKSFAFLFVGGAIERKGFDTLLSAFQSEFTAEDDVCLVVKDMGANTFYRFSDLRDRLNRHIQEGNSPEIVYLNRDMSPGQVAALYRACDCLVAPYRGEGFGLPILEAMACGAPVVVPSGGASDDFTSTETAFLLPSVEVETEHTWRLAGPATELSVRVEDVQRAMRDAYENRRETHAKGQAAAQSVCYRYTWRKTVEQMVERIQHLSGLETPPRAVNAKPDGAPVASLTLVIAFRGEDLSGLVESVAATRPFVDELIVVSDRDDDSLHRLAHEYSLRLVHQDWSDHWGEFFNAGLRRSASDWILCLNGGEWIDDLQLRQLRATLNTSPLDVRGYRVSLTSAVESERPCDIRLFRNAAQLEFQYRCIASVEPALRQMGGVVGVANVSIENREDYAARTTSARELLHRDLAENPGAPHVLRSLAELHFHNGDFFHAECYFQDYIAAESNPDVTILIAYINLIECQFGTGDPHRAVESIQAAEKLFPGDQRLAAMRARIPWQHPNA